MKKIYLLIAIGILLVVGRYDCMSQDKNAHKKRANESIVQLKSGALLVQLQSKQITIDSYREKGYQSIADDIAQKQHEDNIKLIRAFNESFRFCKVYFFLSDQMEALKEKQFENVVFVNKNGDNDPSIKLKESFYMIASYFTEPDKKKNSLLSSSVLTIWDSDFNAMAKPFPYYIKMPEELPKYKRLKKKIYNYDVELRVFYYRQPVQEQEKE